MIRPQDITILTACDEAYLPKLLAAYETWKTKAGFSEMPLCVMSDAAMDPMSDVGLRIRVACHNKHLVYGLPPSVQEEPQKGPETKVVPWTMPEAESQRERMLTSLVFAAEHIPTPWYLKIDADTIATAPSAKFEDWVDLSWFKPDTNGQLPAFITNPWGYTKPGEFLDRLDAWGDRTPGMKEFARLNIQHEPSGKAYHSRIISWLYFGNTAWTKKMVGLLGDGVSRLPVPSQDTFLWYCAARRGDYYITTSMKRRGWGHMGRRSADEIAAEAKKVLGQ